MAVRKFIKFDSELGYLEDKDDINYFATSQMRKVAFGKMLGDFDENGLYVINKKIVEELIKMPKVVVEMVEDADLIRSTIKADAFFHFILIVEDNKASFKLLEKINYQSNRDLNSGSYSNINEYVLDEVIVPDKDFDRNVLYQKYNISTDNNGEALSIFDMDELSIALYYNLIEKLKTNYLVQNELILKEKDIESIEADYFEDMLSVLGEFDEFGQKVKTAVQGDLAEKHTFMIISRPFFQKAINEVLDSYIEQFIQDLSPEQRELFLSKIREVKAKYYQKFKTLVPMEIARKAGVKFDANQIMEESIIGTLAQEITTKGYTSSDVRRILINEDELKLSIAKIKEIVMQNEQECNRNNTNAKDIIKNRKLTTEFYKELESKNKTDLLTEKPLIKSAIDENVASADNAKKADNATRVTQATTNNKTQSAKADKSVKAKKGGSTQRSQSSGKQQAGGAKPQNKATNNQSNKKKDFIIYGTYSSENSISKDKAEEIAKANKNGRSKTGDALDRLRRNRTDINMETESKTHSGHKAQADFEL